MLTTFEYVRIDPNTMKTEVYMPSAVYGALGASCSLIEYGDRVFDADEPRRLVKKREIEKKKGNSRFTNARVRDQWGGYSGTRPNDFRWPLVQTYISDMAGAFKR